MAREAKKDFQGPFLGFTYNGRHSSELGIVRINTGNRAEMPLSPSFKDSTAEVPGGKGLYYFNTQIQQKQFVINFAFDNLTEDQVRELREWFEPTGRGSLIFDEEPFKEYQVKPNAQPKLSYLVFDKPKNTSAEIVDLYAVNEEESGGRIYKGEGSVSFAAFYPYARAPFKELSSYVDKEQSGGFGYKSEWKKAAGFEDKPNVEGLQCYNCGTLESPLSLSFDVSTTSTSVPISGNLGVEFYLMDGTDIATHTKIGYVYIDLNKLGAGDNFTIDSKLELLLAADGTPRNDAILASKFFYLPPRKKCCVFFNQFGGEYTVGLTANTSLNYDYLYL